MIDGTNSIDQAVAELKKAQPHLERAAEILSPLDGWQKFWSEALGADVSVQGIRNNVESALLHMTDYFGT